MLEEKLLIDLVDRVEVLDISQVQGGLDHIGKGDSSHLQDVLHVSEGDHGLLLHPLSHLPSEGLQSNLAREVEHPVQLYSLVSCLLLFV